MNKWWNPNGSKCKLDRGKWCTERSQNNWNHIIVRLFRTNMTFRKIRWREIHMLGILSKLIRHKLRSFSTERITQKIRVSETVLLLNKLKWVQSHLSKVKTSLSWIFHKTLSFQIHSLVLMYGLETCIGKLKTTTKRNWTVFLRTFGSRRQSWSSVASSHKS